MKKFLVILFTAMLALTACGGESEVKEVEDTNEDTTTEQSSANDEKTEEETQETDKIYGLGDTISVDGMEVTINNATWTEANEYVPAENGKVLRLEVAFNNASADNGFVDNTEFSAYDANGNALDLYFGSNDANTNMFSFDLKQGKKGQGVIEFDVPEAEYYEIYYEPTFTLKENAEVQWKIESSKIK